ncbi:TPA: TIGR01620 family protein [Haemophilus influenzae]
MEKQIFEHSVNVEEEQYQPKQEFHNVETKLDEALDGELLDAQLEQALKPKSSFGKTVLKFTALLFGTATVAQSVQWIWDSYQQHQWIYLAFALVSLIVILLGIKEIIGEWRRLVYLKKREQLQQQSQQIWLENSDVFSVQNVEKSKVLCLEVAKSLGLENDSPTVIQWQHQLNEAYSAQEITYLFSRNILSSFDAQAKKLISKMAAESAVIVAISPLVVVDMFFIAWRNLRLMNKIAEIYGIELGYFSRIRLLRMVLVNIAFAGATEVAQDIGMEWLSQDVTAKLSARIAQGIGVGLLTARLGVKAMELCRPLAFQLNEKPKLSHIQQELLSSVKDIVLGKNKIYKKEQI